MENEFYQTLDIPNIKDKDVHLIKGLYGKGSDPEKAARKILDEYPEYPYVVISNINGFSKIIKRDK